MLSRQTPSLQSVTIDQGRMNEIARAEMHCYDEEQNHAVLLLTVHESGKCTSVCGDSSVLWVQVQLRVAGSNALT